MTRSHARVGGDDVAANRSVEAPSPGKRTLTDSLPVQLSASGGGAAGDVYEQHADAVADRVVAGRSAGDLLGGAISAASADHPMDAVQLQADGSKPDMIAGNVVSVTDNEMFGGADVVINRGSKDGVLRDMQIAINKLYGAAPSEVTDHTVKAFVQGGSTKSLRPGDSAIFTPAKVWAPLPPSSSQPANSGPWDPPPQPRPSKARPGTLFGNIVSVGDEVVDQRPVVIDRGAKDGVQPGWELDFGLPGATTGVLRADTFEVREDSVLAYVRANPSDLERFSRAIFVAPDGSTR